MERAQKGEPVTMSGKYKTDTKLIHTGRSRDKTVVNPPVVRGATILFDNIADMHHREEMRYDSKESYYGRYGTPTAFALAEALAELDGADQAVLFPSGVAAAAGALLSVLKSGDHVLMTEGIYPNSRNFCENALRPLGIEPNYYDPLIGKDIAKLIKPNTKAIFMESPASNTMEFLDVPAIVRVAKQHNITTIMDNTWATPLRFRPLDFGVDIAMQSATKYICGHSDILMGVVCAKQPLAKQIMIKAMTFGYCVSPDDCYLALRGLRTMLIRLDASEKSARRIAGWLKDRNEVQTVLHPDHDAASRDLFKRDFKGGNGVFSFILHPHYSAASIQQMVEKLHLFKLGFSWGGFESLIMPQDPNREFSRLPKGQLLRLTIGLENPDDLMNDLEKAFEFLK